MLWDNTLIELFIKGGFAMWPLLATSVFGLAIMLDRAIVLLSSHVSFDGLIDRLRPLVRNRQIDHAVELLRGYRGPLAYVALVYLQHLSHPRELRDEIVGREASRQVARLEKRLTWLGTLASVATLLGLLGTVTGLVSAFHQIEVKAGHVQPGDLAAGIWEALITTVFGLVIAIPCLAAYHFLDNLAARAALQLQWLTTYLDEWLYDGSDGAARPRKSDLPREVGATAQ